MSFLILFISNSLIMSAVSDCTCCRVSAICKIKQSRKTQKERTGSEIQGVNELRAAKESMMLIEEGFQSFILRYKTTIKQNNLQPY